MTLGELLPRLATDGSELLAGGTLTPADADQAVVGVSYDSRHVNPGDVFVALRGQHEDGARFAAEALRHGAVAVVAETEAPPDIDVPWFVVADARLALAALAADIHGNPSQELVVVGITGTNGKTTTSYLVHAMFEKAGLPCGRVGTVGYRFGSVERVAARTTPEAADLQSLLRDMVDSGCRSCAIEVSSHALSLRRVDHIRFGAAVFTNLSRDHLDFHGDMESYFVVKRRLFEMLPREAFGIVNVDDPRGPELASIVRRPVTFGVDQPADVTPAELSMSLHGVAFDVQTPRGRLHARSRLIGQFSVYNILAAVSVGVALDLPFSAIEQGIAAVERVPGRCELASGGADDVTVLVDYAHTDDALRRLLEAVRPLSAGRVITVFGCGGDRDRTKRPLMGAVAARRSDLVIVTSDNPRSEEPAAIIEEITGGMRSGGERISHIALVDRRQAIERAIREARPGDVVVVAGKGHENYQEIAGRVLKFDDVEVAREALAHRRSGSPV